MRNGMVMEMYSEQAVRHFMAPSHTAPLREISGIGCATSDTSEDIIELSIHISRSGVIDGIRCRTYGCPAAVAAGSALAELLDGMTLGETAWLRPEDVLSAVGGLPSRQARYALLPLLALKAAVENHRERLACGPGKRASRFVHKRICGLGLEASGLTTSAA